jgi:hypothetical protein
MEAVKSGEAQLVSKSVVEQVLNKMSELCDLICENATLEYDGQSPIVWVSQDDLLRLKEKVRKLFGEEDEGESEGEGVVENFSEDYDLYLEDQADTMREMEVE